MMEFEAKVTGVDEAIIGARAIHAGIAAQIRHIVEDAAELALTEMEASVPKSGRTDHETIAEALHITQTEYAPGGAGGGGFYQTRVTTGEDGPTHLKWVLEGSGIHGPYGTRIYPQAGKGLAYFGDKGNIVRRSVAGQRPQTAWLERGQEIARARVEEGLYRLRLE